MSVPKIFAPLHQAALPEILSIEISSHFQLPSFHIIGLPAPEISEARERVRSAIESSGFEFPRKKLVVNLSPASVRKEGTGIDLAIALAILGTLPSHSGNAQSFPSAMAWGELGLDGLLKPSGRTTRVLFAAWSAGLASVILPIEELGLARNRLEDIAHCRQDFGLSKTPPVLLGALHLRHAYSLLLGGVAESHCLGAFSGTLSGTAQSSEILLSPEDVAASHSMSVSRSTSVSMAGEEFLLPLPPVLERVLGISAAGRHHLLLVGPQGAGKSHALEWRAALEPKISPSTLLTRHLLQELRDPSPPLASERRTPPAFASCGSISGESSAPFIVRRISALVRPSALTGYVGPRFVRPGEFSLAHGGLLLADEFPEWPRDSREALREPLERGKISLTRARTSLELPAQFVFAATANFCPCGGWPSSIPIPGDGQSNGQSDGRSGHHRCRCSVLSARNYRERLSGPVMDRIDLMVQMGQVPATESSRESLPVRASRRMKELKEKIRNSQDRSRKNWGDLPGVLPPTAVEDIFMHAKPRSGSLRNRHKIMRIALSLASWDESDEVRKEHLAEAELYRAEAVFGGNGFS